MRSISGYVLAAAMGAIGGGLFVALATKAIPNMMARVRENGFSPAEM